MERGVSCRRGIAPVHLEPLYVARFGSNTLAATEEVSDTSLLLPMFASLSDTDQTRVISAVTELLGR